MAIRSPLAPTLEELAAKPTERVKIALSAPTGHLSHRERQDPHPPAAAGTYTLLCNCHWQLLNFDSLRGAPPQGKAGVTDCHTSVRTGSQ